MQQAMIIIIKALWAWGGDSPEDRRGRDKILPRSSNGEDGVQRESK